MTKKRMVFFLMLVVVMVWCLPVSAQTIVSGKIQAIDRAAKTITIGGTQYLLGDKAAQTPFKAGDTVEATVEGNEVTKLVRLLQ